jgi:hypothetical protein
LLVEGLFRRLLHSAGVAPVLAPRPAALDATEPPAAPYISQFG